MKSHIRDSVVGQDTFVELPLKQFLKVYPQKAAPLEAAIEHRTINGNDPKYIVQMRITKGVTQLGCGYASDPSWQINKDGQHTKITETPRYGKSTQINEDGISTKIFEKGYTISDRINKDGKRTVTFEFEAYKTMPNEDREKKWEEWEEFQQSTEIAKFRKKHPNASITCDKENGRIIIEDV